ncbi:hypothetical protein C8Q80DRAFT_1114162 [Daedaleopsis nitida]|nr:hypothetical protein C8Q80DRAFT_1114162 [Daedaleopsis nitida]
MHHLFLTCYPSFLFSALIDGENAITRCSSARNATIAILTPTYTRNHTLPAPQPQPRSLTFHSIGSRAETSSIDLESDYSTSSPASVTYRSPHAHREPLPAEATSRALPRIPLPLPFSDASISRRIDFHHCGRRGVNLDDWAKLSEKRRTYLAIDDAREGLDEMFEYNDGKILFQSHWPGYDTRTCFLEMPAGVTDCGRAFTKADLLDMVCQALVDWVLNITNRRHIECRDPRWAVGLKQITFKHIYVTSVVEVKGYVSKWAPVLEIDPRAFETS